MAIHLGWLLPATSSNLPEHEDETFPQGRAPAVFLSGLAPGGVYPADPVASIAVRSYRTFSPLPCGHGGLFSVALSLRSPSPGVTRHRGSVEPGLSSSGAGPPAAIQPSDLNLYSLHLMKCQDLQCVGGSFPGAVSTRKGKTRSFTVM